MARSGAETAFPTAGEIAGTQRWPLRSYLELAALPTAVPCARLHAKNIAREWRMTSLADTVELIVSEITTNAVRASASNAHQLPTSRWATAVPIVRLCLTSDGHRILIQVWDSDHDIPSPRNAGLDAESGRGLMLVQALSTRWGCYRPHGQNGKIVWAMCVNDHWGALKR